MKLYLGSSWPDRIFDVVIINLNATIVEVNTEQLPQVEDVIQSQPHAAAGHVVKTRRTWSNGKLYLKASFDQRIGQPLRGPTPFWLKGVLGLACAILVLVAQALGLIPSGEDLIASIPVKNQQSADLLNAVMPYGYCLFPAIAALAVGIYLSCVDPNHARVTWKRPVSGD